MSLFTSPRALAMAVFTLAVFVWPVGLVGQEDGNRYITEADRLFGDGDYEGARELYRRYLDEFGSGPHAAKAAFAIGRCYAEEDRVNEAIAAYNNALQRFGDDPGAPAAYRRLGLAKLEKGYLQEALDAFKTALETATDPALQVDLYHDLAETHYQLGNYRDAVEPFIRLIGHLVDAEKTLDANIKLADCYYRAGDFASAKAILKLQVEKDRTFLSGRPAMTFRWAECLLFTGEYERARDVLMDLLRGYPEELFENHIFMRLGDVEMRLAEMEKDPAKRKALCISAIESYQRLIKKAGLPNLTAAAACRIVECADLGGVDLQEDMNLSSPDELLQQAHSQALDSATMALVLLQLARHRLALRQDLEALDTYNRILKNHWDLALASAVRAEYNQLAHDLMQQAFDGGDFLKVCLIHLNHGQDLRLDGKEKFQIAESYLRVQISSQAEAFFESILRDEEDRELQRKAFLGLARLEVQGKKYNDAVKRLRTFLEREPPEEEREQAMLLLLDSLYSMNDLESLRSFWYEQTSELSTPQTKATCLYLLAVLSNNNSSYDEATSLFERLLNEFSEGIAGNFRIYGYLRETYRSLGDLYYMKKQWERAAAQYEIYIALFGDSQDLSWPLFQIARCRIELGMNRLALAVLQELIRLYPDSAWSREARIIRDELEEKTGGGA
jgi:TolA-binding protein